MNIILEMMV